MTNMKRTLLHSVPAYDALMWWYDLRDTVSPFLGDRLTNLFSHAISSETDCLICSTYFRRIIIDAGEDVENLTLDEREQAVVDFGRCLAQRFARVPDELYSRVASYFDDEQMVALVAFGAMMVATNVVNNALDVPLDDYLQDYRKDAQSSASTGSGSPSTSSG
jgi:alkylhydroperoxidase family enzyme